MAIVVGDNIFPDIPEEQVGVYPYVAIVKMSMPEYGVEMTMMLCSDEPHHYLPGTLIPTDSNYNGVDGMLVVVDGNCNYINGELSEDSTAWDFSEASVQTGSLDFPLLGDTYCVLWANYDILTATAVNSDGTYSIGDEVYLASGWDSGYAEKYSMPYEWFVGMAAQTRRLKGITGKMLPDSMLSNLKVVNSLEPKLAEMDSFVAGNPDLPLTLYVDGTEHNFKLTIPEFMVDYIDTVVAPNLLYIPTQAFESGNKYIGSSGFTNLQLKTAIFNSATDMGAGVFAYQYELSKIIAPKLTILRNSFTGCEGLVEITKDFFPEATEITYTTFNGCFNLTRADFPKVSKMSNYVFSETNLTVLILRNDSKVCTFSGVDSDTFGETPLAAGKGVVLVPTSLVATYPTYGTWDRIASAGSKFLPLEQYTVDGTLTGDIDWAKVDAELAKL